MKIDIFTHVQLEKYKKTIYRSSDRFITDKNVQDKRTTLTDTDLRRRLIDKYEDYVQVLTATHPPPGRGVRAWRDPGTGAHVQR